MGRETPLYVEISLEMATDAAGGAIRKDAALLKKFKADVSEYSQRVSWNMVRVHTYIQYT
jgi:hypothetical protein